MLPQFFLAWLIGLVGIVLPGQAGRGWLALLLVAGLLLVMLGVRLWRDRRAWLAFVENQSSLIPHPSGRWTQRFTAAGIVVIALGWSVGGVVGVLALLT